MDELQIRLVLRFSVPKDGLTVNGILKGLEEQTPLILSILLEMIFRSLEERAVGRMTQEYPGHYMSNGHQPNARKLITHFGAFRYRMIQMIDIHTGKTIVPLAQTLAMVPYKQYQAKALESSIGLAIHLPIVKPAAKSYGSGDKDQARARRIVGSRSCLRPTGSGLP